MMTAIPGPIFCEKLLRYPYELDILPILIFPSGIDLILEFSKLNLQDDEYQIVANKIIRRSTSLWNYQFKPFVYEVFQFG